MDTDQLQTLFEKNYSHLYACAYKVVGERHAYDVVMDVFVYILEHPHCITDYSTIQNYLAISVRNKCTDLLRRKAIVNEELTIICDDIVPEELCRDEYERIDNKLVVREIFRIIKSLPPQQREVIELSFFGGATREEIAKLMRISPNTVRNHKVTAMRVIKLNLSLQ